MQRASIKWESMNRKLAVHGGEPVREEMLPYARQWIDEGDTQALIEVLSSDWLTTGPKVAEFEEAFAGMVGARHAVAVSNGTAAVHAAMYAIDIRPGDEVIVPSMTFAASANCVVFQGGRPVFADVDPGTLLLDPSAIEAKVTERTQAIIAVDYAGQPCAYDELRAISDRHGLILVDDACHALGGSYRGRMVGTLADLNTFSFHPAKHITTGEGGMITTADADYAQRMRDFRNHGITSTSQQRELQGSWFHEIENLGYNYRLTDLQCALGTSQLRKLRDWVSRRQEIARRYDAALAEIASIEPLSVQDDVQHAYHLYMVQLDLSELNASRAQVFDALRAEGIGVNVHYIPVHLHPYYRKQFGTQPGLCPVAEAAYQRLVTLPIFPRMSNRDVGDVITAVAKVIEAYGS